MTKYNDFTGDISVDFEDVHAPFAEKLKDLLSIKLHKDDRVIGIKLTAGEYHHSRKRLPLIMITLEVINVVDYKKEKKDMKIKEIREEITMEQFIRLFKRLELNLKPHNQRYAS